MTTRAVGRGDSGLSPGVTSFLLVGSVWLVSRLGLGVLAGAQMIGHDVTLTEVVSRWDVLHFLGIARHGYLDPNDVAFFPGLPALLAAAGRLGLPLVGTGIVLSLLASGLAAWALARLGGPIVACLWLVAPTAVFTAVPYTEALFCAAAFWAWWFATQDRWGTAAACAGLACTFRVSGLFLVGALGLLALSQVWRTSGWARGLARRSAWLLVPLAVLGGYALYLHHLTGTWTAWLVAEQAGWARSFTDPLSAFRNTWRAGAPSAWPGRPEVAWVFRAEIVSMALGLVATLWSLARRQWARAGFVGVQVLAFGTSYWYMSVTRAVLLWFPLFVLLAGLVTWQPADPRRRLAWRVLVIFALVVQVLAMLAWAWLFLTGRWSG